MHVHCEEGEVAESWLVAAAACLTASCVIDGGMLLRALQLLRKDEALSRLLHDVSVHTSSGGSMYEELPSLTLQEQEEKPRSNLQKLVERARPEFMWLAAGCLALFIRLPFSLALPHFVSETIGALIDKDSDAVRSNITSFIIAAVIDSLLDFWCVFLFGYTQQRLVRSLRIDLFRNLLLQDTSFFDASSSGEISSRLTSDCAEMANDLTWVFRFTIEALVRIGGIAGYMFFRSWRLASLACSIIPIVAVVNRFYSAWMSKNAQMVQEALAEANGVAQEVLSSMRTVFSFANEPRELRRYEKAVQKHFVLNVRQTAISGLYYMGVCTFLMSCCVQSSLLIYGSLLVFNGELEATTLLSFMLYQGQLQEYFSNLLNSFTNLIKSAGAGAKVFELLGRRPRIKRSGLIKLTEVRGKVTLEHVSFCYPSRESLPPALDDVSFQVSPGNIAAIVGPSGAGKSTIFHLLEHLYEPSSGRVCLDDVEVSELEHGWLHRMLALVGQEPVLFSGSIESNILYGYYHRLLEDGGESGEGLQEKKQRIAIARAVIQDPKVLLLDEATSALDSESEALVQEALEHVMERRTVLVIAHRLSTVSRADVILLLNKGRIVEQGTHQELLARPLPPDGGLSYRTLLNRQAKALSDPDALE
ncbi:hypothetical protein GUITHDRAFT_119675 [Guillardia theta CCMP2712]|uniref:ABC transporter n=1 Tax=Guillardia theta (strain CCMP2712) TaxID=905079 RepID=L1IE66_GUITC|nr:hypothetical protein GUITHDRAFT_119675 [Guillardia theta CCMP2712]EKX34120.1 hypothetical protein GUITHDRAFT_119675 [Guillardia theta CCMP2712]|eukprot:XP_005821100.1 hypothetical protein GUITHDRAFT_119675 [Guillardia theta CCMP2712]